METASKFLLDIDLENPSGRSLVANALELEPQATERHLYIKAATALGMRVTDLPILEGPLQGGNQVFLYDDSPKPVGYAAETRIFDSQGRQIIYVPFRQLDTDISP
jgi:hypothetical protein